MTKPSLYAYQFHQLLLRLLLLKLPCKLVVLRQFRLHLYLYLYWATGSFTLLGGLKRPLLNRKLSVLFIVGFELLQDNKY